MNLVQAVFAAAEENLKNGDEDSHETYIYFEGLEESQKIFINDFFYMLLGYEYIHLLDWCRGKIDKPIMREIIFTWSIADVQKKRPDLTDAQASEVLSLLLKKYDETIGINFETIETGYRGFVP